MTASVVVADDEALARRRIVRLLREREDVEVVAQCAGGAEAVGAIREQHPTWCFSISRCPTWTASK